MADQTVKIQSDGDKFRVAYEMAKDIWYGAQKSIDIDNKDEFLDLVQECVQALNGGMRRSIV